MSWWVSRTGKQGTPELWAIDFDPVLAIVVATVPLIVLLSYGLLSVAILAVGFSCLVIAKVSLFRRGVWVSWGPKLMSARASAIYKIGYLLIAIGAVLRLTVRV